MGFPILLCDEIYADIDEGDDVVVDLVKGTITAKKTGVIYQAEPFPEFVLKIMEAGGIIEYIKKYG